MASSRARRIHVAAALVVVLLGAALLAGCATVPTSGPVQQVNGPRAAGQGQDLPQVIPRPPERGWNPKQIVDGFLAASASFAYDHAVAREYLAPEAAREWHPGAGARVVSRTPQATLVGGFQRQLSAQQPVLLAKVKVTWQQLATLTDSGQYQSSSSPRQETTFTLEKISGQWRIESVPPASLLLTETDFLSSYQPRNLYFFAPSGKVLVPDPVFVPQLATNADVVGELVKGLMNSPVGWQAGATVTSFPRGTRPLAVRIDNTNVTVNLSGAASRASQHQRAMMAAQLVWTLTSSSYAPPLSQSVQLAINGHGPLQIGRGPFQLRQQYAGLVPGSSATAEPYFIGHDGLISVLSGPGQPRPGQLGSATVVPGQAGSVEAPPMTAIAISPDRRFLAGIPAVGRGIYLGALSRGATLRRERLPGFCTSLSWDSRGDLWAVTTKGGIWMLTPGKRLTSQVYLTLSAGERVVALRVAPDSVRVAMLVHGASGNAVLAGAISYNGLSVTIGETITIGAGITNPVAITWYNADNVLVLTRRARPQLAEIPLNGGQPTLIGTEPGTVSVASNGTDLVVGLGTGKLLVSTTAGAVWEPTAASGHMPVYPG